MLSWMRDKFNVSRQKFGRVLFRRSTHDCELTISEESSYSNINQKMLVEDTDPFPDEKIKLHIIGLDGLVWTIRAPPDISISTLKTMALNHFFNPIESANLQQNYKLIAVSTKRVLQPDNSIQDEELASEEEILLAERRVPVTDIKENVVEEKGPSKKDILAATLNLTPANIVKIPALPDCSDYFQNDFKKILVSLIEICAQLLATQPNAEEIFETILERLETRDKIVPDFNAARNFVQMGFKEERVNLALRLKRNNPHEALEWLLDDGNNKIADDLENEDSEDSIENPTVMQSVAKVLASFRTLRRKEFRPNAKYLLALKEMGFQETEVIEALLVTGNNQSDACEWLLGDRSEAIQDLCSGLDPESTVYKALLANPTIQLGLSNPNILSILLSILENPQSSNNWLHDPEISPILNQIFKIYHGEKHIITVNSHVETYSNNAS